MKLVRYSGGDDWSALYVDGRLDKVGDHYLIDERISHLAGVDVRSSDAFMQGGNNYSDVAQTLEEAEAYEERQDEASQRREALLAEAARLVAQAQELQDKANTM